MRLDLDTIREILDTGHRIGEPFTMYQFKHAYTYSLADISERQISSTLLGNGFRRVQRSSSNRRVWHYAHMDWASQDRRRKGISVLGAAGRLSSDGDPFTLAGLRELLPDGRQISDKIIGETLLGNGYRKCQLTRGGVRAWHYVRRDG